MSPRPARSPYEPGAGGSPEELAELARTALAEAAAGRLRPVVGQEFELAAAARAHAAIETRQTVGKTLLTVPRLARGLALRRGSSAGRPGRQARGRLSVINSLYKSAYLGHDARL